MAFLSVLIAYCRKTSSRNFHELVAKMFPRKRKQRDFMIGAQQHSVGDDKDIKYMPDNLVSKTDDPVNVVDTKNYQALKKLNMEPFIKQEVLSDVEKRDSEPSYSKSPVLKEEEDSFFDSADVEDRESNSSYAKCSVTKKEKVKEEQVNETPFVTRSYKHPQHLRGKAIGMFYAQKSKMKMKRLDQEQRLTVSLDERKLSTILESLKDKEYKSQEYNSDGFAVKNFMQEYWSHMHVSDRIDRGIVPQNQRNAFINQNEAKDRELLEDYQRRQHTSAYKKMQEFRYKLPAHKIKDNILSIIEKNQVVLISGETGCGKTTQVPQFILDHYIEAKQGSLCRIICTQPRRISAISVAERVADERGTLVGKESEVGYHIRLESKQPRKLGSILYCTTGIVLERLQNDPLISEASHIIVDEVHERSLHSDFLITLLKDIIPKRPDLKVILMSATLDSDTFSKYFWNCPRINIEGFTYPVHVYTLEDVLEITGYVPENGERNVQPFKRRGKAKQKYDLDTFYNSNPDILQMYSSKTLDIVRNWNDETIDLDLVFELLKNIDCDQTEGAVLVFLPGWDQISKLNSLILNSRHFSTSKHKIIPLHSMMPTVNQRDVFNKPPPGVRKIVLATNIAETSITIDDVVYVIDCGKIKMTNFDTSRNVTTLQPEWVAKSNIMQRRGRAGRTQPGICYHLISKYRMSKLDNHQLPELLRTRLEETILKIKILKLGKVKPFLLKAMQPPEPMAVDLSLDLLYKLSALVDDEKLTPLGYHLANLPMDPQLGKMIIFGAIFSCLDPILSIAASLSFKDPFIIPLGKEEVVDKIRRNLANGSQSDHLMLAHVFKEWEKLEQNGNGFSFCHKNFLSVSTIKMLHNLKQQFAKYLHQQQFLECENYTLPIYNINSDKEMLLKAIICAGLYPNVAKILIKKHGNLKISTVDQNKVEFHPKSINSMEKDPKSMWMVYHLKVKSSKIFLHDSTLVHPIPLLLFGGKLNVSPSDDQFIVSIDNWIEFNCREAAAKLIKELRDELNDLLRFRICNPGVTDWSSQSKEGCLLKCLVDLITSEDISSDHFNTSRNLPTFGSHRYNSSQTSFSQRRNYRRYYSDRSSFPQRRSSNYNFSNQTQFSQRGASSNYGGASSSQNF